MDNIDYNYIAEIIACEMLKTRENSDYVLTLEKACKLIDGVLREAEKKGVKGVAAVCDAGGNVKAVKCMDDSYIASYDIAVNKAYTSVALKMSTKALSGLSKPGDSLYGIQFTCGGRIVIFGGGVPLKVGDKIVGGFGISGGTEEQDTYLGSFAEKLFAEML